MRVCLPFLIFESRELSQKREKNGSHKVVLRTAWGPPGHPMEVLQNPTFDASVVLTMTLAYAAYPFGHPKENYTSKILKNHLIVLEFWQ